MATDEIRVGDNDRLAALVAHLVGADGLVLLSDVDGLYDGDPRRPGARQLTEVHAPADLDARAGRRAGAAGLGTGGMATKITAADDGGGVGHPGPARRGRGRDGRPGRLGRRARRSARRSGRRAGGCRRAGSGCGTPPTCAGRSTWTPARWRRCSSTGASLLAAGIHGISGDFVAGDVVDLVGPHGVVVARGVVGFRRGRAAGADRPPIPGRRTRAAPRGRARRRPGPAAPLTRSAPVLRSRRGCRPPPARPHSGGWPPPTAPAPGWPTRSARRSRIRTPAVEEAFRTVPRHLFLPDVSTAEAYADEAVAVQHVDGVATSSASQPSMVAIMLEQLGAAARAPRSRDRRRHRLQRGADGADRRPGGCGRGGRHRPRAHRVRRSAPGRGRLPRRRADLRGRGAGPSGGSAVRPDRAHRRSCGRPPGLGGAARVRWPVAAAAGGARQPAVGGARPRSGRAAAQRLRAQLRLHPAARDRGGHGRHRPPRGRPARAGARRRSGARRSRCARRRPWTIPARSAGRRSR